MNATVTGIEKTANETGGTMTIMTENPLIEIPVTEMFEICGTLATPTTVAGIETIETPEKEICEIYATHAIHATFEIRVTYETEIPATCETSGMFATAESPIHHDDSMTGDPSRAQIHVPIHVLPLDWTGGRHLLRYQRQRLS